MKILTIIGICSLVSVVLLACGSGGTGLPPDDSNANSNNGGGASGGGAGSSTGGTGSGGGNSSSSGTASGAGSSGSSGGQASGGPAAASDAGVSVPQNNPEIDYASIKTLAMDTFTVPSNGEVYKCQDFANPWGKQVDIKTYVLDMAAGSHHMFAFYKSGATNGPVGDCPSGGLEFGPFTFTSQQHEISQTYPATVGATIPQGTGFTLMVHYLNTSQAPVDSHVVLTMAIAKPAAVTQHAGVLYLDNTSMIVAPGVSTSTKSYTLPQDVQILSTWSHMHQQATRFISSASSGETLFTTTEWAEPPAKPYSPPLALKSGTSITWSCTYDNVTNQTLTFGQSAKTNVMCISLSVFYPVADPSNPVIGIP